jgi:uracil-DNA glycosylase family protein
MATSDITHIACQAAACRRCDLWRHANKLVFGEGPEDAALMLVGEQPGDREDLAGRPFVGPAGRLLDEVLVEAGISRDTVYVTNAVKHFKFVPRGKRRIHRNPSAGEIDACRWWLELELRRVRPTIVVLLGASAAQAVLRRRVTIGRERGHPIPLGEFAAMVTIHPSWLLRMPDPAMTARERRRFVADLRTAHEIARPAP